MNRFTGKSAICDNVIVFAFNEDIDWVIIRLPLLYAETILADYLSDDALFILRVDNEFFHWL